MVYPAIFIEENNGSWSVLFPDLDNLATCGFDYVNAKYMAVDCLAGYLQWLEEDGETAPEPSKAKDIKLYEWYDPEDNFKDIFVEMIDSREYDEPDDFDID